MLSGSNLVMLRFCKNSDFPKLLVEVFHVFGNAGLDCTEVMVVKLLTLGRACAEKSSACVNEVFTLVIHLFVNKEVFLLGAYGGLYGLDVLVSEQLQNTQRLAVDCLH